MSKTEQVKAVGKLFSKTKKKENLRDKLLKEKGYNRKCRRCITHNQFNKKSCKDKCPYLLAETIMF